MSNQLSPDYKAWIVELKSKVRSSQIKAAIAVNSALIVFYWELSKMISEKENVWGSKLIKQVAQDLKTEFAEMKGLSATNLKYCKRFYEYYKIESKQSLIGQQLVDQLQNTENENEIISQQLVDQIPWGHNKLLIRKVKDQKETKLSELRFLGFRDYRTLNA